MDELVATWLHFSTRLNYGYPSCLESTEVVEAKKKARRYSGRRSGSAEGESVRGCGRRAYAAALEGGGSRTGLLKCRAEFGRIGHSSIETTVARSNRTACLSLLQIRGTHRFGVGCARHGIAGAATTDIIGVIACNRRQRKIVTILQRN